VNRERVAYETIIFEKRGHIGYLTLNQPRVFNAINSQLISEIREAIREVEKDNEIRVLIITGAGKAFQSGADTEDLGRMGPLELHEGKDYGDAPNRPGRGCQRGSGSFPEETFTSMEGEITSFREVNNMELLKEGKGNL
jgi:enoyl-CoA hydratase/carnithine racemase